MANLKITQLPAATSPVASTDVLPVVQSGATKQAAIDQLGFLPAGTGAVTVTIQDKLRESVSVKDFGAVGDGVTDDTAAIQAAENYAATAGKPINLYFPSGTFAITATIQKRAQVHWFGAGKIKRRDNLAPTGTQYALVYANAVNDWSIDGLSFEAIAQDVVIANGLLRANGNSPNAGNWNSCIDAYKCQRWDVRNCTFQKFSQGIKYTGSGNFSISFNKLYAENAYTVANMLAGTAQSFAYAGTGGLCYLYDATLSVLSLGPSLITDNEMVLAGLDSGIELSINVFDNTPSICTNNRIQGPHAGIISYQGSVVDPQHGSTYNQQQIISNNWIYATWEQGIYLRGLFGVQVLGNYIERAALTNSDVDSSAGSIIARVNPFDSAVAAVFLSATNNIVSNDHGTIISDNRCVDQGRSGVTTVACIYIRIDNVKVTNNIIERSAEAFSASTTTAILVSNGGRLKNIDVCGNTILGYWANGIIVSDVVRPTSINTHYGKIKNNVIQLVGATYAIDVLWYAFNLDISDNDIFAGATTGIRLRFSPYSKIVNNRFYSLTTGINLADGCLASDFAYLVSGGVATRAIRRGGTTTVTNNDFQNVTTPHAVSNIDTGDASFAGRCSIWENDKVNGLTYYSYAYSGGTPPTTFTAQTWNTHDQTKNTAVAVGQTPGRVCISPGTYGIATTTTGTASLGSPIITAVANLDGYGPGMYLNPSSGFASVVSIVSVNYASSTITVSANANANAVGATLTVATPTFGTLPVLT